jgi:hypothetical protein
MDQSLRDAVWQRAKGRREYCQMPQTFYRTRHQIDHIIAEQHGGPTTLDNLALACLPCNNHKGPNISGINFATHRIVRLFNPRKDRWGRRFAWDGPRLRGKTAIGRATIEVLAINHPDFVAVREALILEGTFPPRD